LLAKDVWRLEKLLVGGGMFAKASEAFDILPSLLPVRASLNKKGDKD